MPVDFFNDLYQRRANRTSLSCAVATSEELVETQNFASLLHQRHCRILLMDAVIVDMDGVISNTERLQCIAESEVLSKYGIFITAQDMVHRFSGMPGKKVWEIIFEEYGMGLPPEQALRDAKSAILKTSKNNIQAITGSISLIQALNIAALFDVIVSGTEVENGKPAPDIFLFTAKKMKVTPDQCVVIEDATSGVAAAKAAGMKCIGFKPKESMQDLSMADLVVTDLRDVHVDMLRSM